MTAHTLINDLRKQDPSLAFPPGFADMLASDHGIVLNGYVGFIDPSLKTSYGMAVDAQPGLVTTSSGGVPAFLTTYVDPEVIRILTQPNKAAVIFGESKIGDWTTDTSMFPVAESTGEVTTYGDFNENGRAGTNINWVNRQSYLFQTVTQWGEREMERMGAARIDYAQRLNIASALVLDKFRNTSYFFGITGLQNYGALNDPNLPASITPSSKTAGGYTWANGTAAELYSDIVLLWSQLQTQMPGLIERDTPMVLALPPQVEANLTKTNQYNVNVTDQIKKNFPNLRIETAVQYATAAGNLVQLFPESVDGQRVIECHFNEKLRAHNIVVGSSNWKQKKTAGTWGAILKMPIAIASMLGV